ncbi:MAG: phosphate acetyltransferase [Kiritimatiellia bacterium]|nr:phosphate acetyltransferase [Kiritimatiellia bacterium]
MNLLEQLAARAKAAGKTVVLPEGQDPRVITAAVKATQDGLAKVVVLGTPGEIAAAEQQAGLSLAANGIRTIDYTLDPIADELAAAFYERRKAKGMTPDEALKTMRGKRIYFGAMMLSLGKVDALVAGSIASTGDMLRAAFQCVGTRKGIATASSCFVMQLKQPTPAGDEVLLFGDCAVNPNPTAEQLADIGYATALSYKALVGKQPKVAFLSFSTKGSAKHELVDKVRQARELAEQKFAQNGLDAIVDGEMQADAALVPSVAAAKNKDGKVQGNANVLIFPDLQAGNIAYKLVQRLAGAEAVGPVVQGVAKPINDLSRGCSAEDIYNTISISICETLV